MTKIEMTKNLQSVLDAACKIPADFTNDGDYTLAKALLDTGNMCLIAKALTIAYNSGADYAASEIRMESTDIVRKSNASTVFELGEI
jgi:hypothetical protein